MAIGSLSSRRLFGPVGLIALAFVFLTLQPVVADQIKKKDGTVINWQILSVTGDGTNKQVWMSPPNGGAGKIPYYISDIDTVTMAAPDSVVKAKGAAPAAVITALEPAVKQYAGLPVDWVVEAMGQLAEAYGEQGQGDLATNTYNQIDTFYPGSKYHLQAVAGKALLCLKAGKPGDALAAVQPIIDAANKNLAPSQSEGGLYANAYLVYGQALEAQKRPEEALEAYLTVKTMFYQNPNLAEQADQLAKKLRDANPGVGVE